MPEPPQPQAETKVSPIVADWSADYKKQRYERLLDSLVEYTEDRQGAEDFLQDLSRGLDELLKPQMATIEAIRTIQDHFPDMSTTNPTATRHHPSWREVRDDYLTRRMAPEELELLIAEGLV